MISMAMFNSDVELPEGSTKHDDLMRSTGISVAELVLISSISHHFTG